MAIPSPAACPLGKTYFIDNFSVQDPTKWTGTENVDSGYLFDTDSDWLVFSENPSATLDEYVEVQLDLRIKFKQDAAYSLDPNIFALGDSSLTANYIALKWKQNVGDFKYDLTLMSSGGSDVILHRNDEDDTEKDIWLQLRIYSDQVFGYIDGKYAGKIAVDSILSWTYSIWAETVVVTEYSKMGAFYIVGAGLPESCTGVVRGTQVNLGAQAENLKDYNIATDAHIAYDKLNLTGNIQEADLATGELHGAADTTSLENKKVLYYEEHNNISTGATAEDTDVSTIFDGENTATSAGSAEGYITDTPKNYVTILDYATKAPIDDGSGNVVYGRLTESSNVWTLSYYSIVATVETVHEFTDDTAIDIYVAKRTNLHLIPEDFVSIGGIGGGSGSSIELNEHINSLTAHPAANITVAFTPSNYTPGDTKVEDHLVAIDTALSASGGDGLMGTPTDGGYDDGLLDITTTTQINDAVDGMNEVLAEIAPAAPDPLTSTDLQIYSSTTTKYTGRLSTGSSFYEGAAGDNVNYIISDATFTLETLSSTFNWADLGTLKLQINGVQVDSFDLAADFVELERDGDQAYPPKNSPSDFITITEVGKFNDFRLWQKGVARINIVPGDLRQGYNYIKLVHDGISTPQETNLWKIFYDDDAGAAPVVGTPTFIEANLISSKYLSGVQYYSLTDQFYLSVVGSNLFNNVYLENAIQYSTSGISTAYVAIADSSVSPVLSVPPVIAETMTVSNKTITINVANAVSNNLRITTIPNSPYGLGSSVLSASNNILLNTYGNVATDLVDSFVDENYRLPDNDGSAYPNNYDIIPVSRTGNWTSATVISNGSGESQLYNGDLLYPSIDFTTGYFPAQSADYSSFSGDKHYLRSFYKATPMSSGLLTFTGFVLADIEAAGDAKIEIKLPSQTGWLDLGKPYDFGTFTGVDGDGCRTSDSGSDFGWTAGSFSTASSGNMIIVRITLESVVGPVTYIALS